MTGIYKITNPKGRIYIGQSIDIEYRFNCYRKLQSCKSQKLLYRSFNKYGIENHTFEIIEECDDNNLNNRERYYQEYFKVLKGGLNCKLTTTEDKSGKLSEETKLNISKGNSGKIRTEELKIRLSRIHKGKKLSEEHVEKLRLKALNISDETRLKMSKARKGGKNPLSKKVICTETGKIWNSITECAEEIGIRMKLLSRYLNNIHPNKTSIIYLKDYE